MSTHPVRSFPLACAVPQGLIAHCRLDVVHTAAGWFAVFTDIGYPGSPSVTNAAEFLARRYHDLADLMFWPEPLPLRYVQHTAEQPDDWCEFQLSPAADEVHWRILPEDIAWDLAAALGELEERCSCV